LVEPSQFNCAERQGIGCWKMRGKIYEMLKEGKSIEEIRKELGLRASELRSLIVLLKRLGIPLYRRGDKYVVGSLEVAPISAISFHDVLTASIQATKVLRFLYGEDVKFLWPNAVVKGHEVVARIKGPELRIEGKLDKTLSSAVLYRTRQVMRSRRLGELVRAANILLYRDYVEIITEYGVVLTRLKNINIEGNAVTEEGMLSYRSVKEVRLRLET